MPVSSFEKMNFGSKKVRTFRQLLVILSAIYLFGCGGFVLIRMIGESYPQTWDAIVTLINGMSIEFAIDKASQLFNSSSIFLAISLIFALAFWLLGWQILRVALLATALLGLAHLSCAILLLLIQSSLAHAVILGLLALVFAAAFVTQSNLLIYLRDKTYLDASLEGLVLLFFLVFIGRMLRMALAGGTA